ncbi:hypothetical protein RSG63_004231 [Yersinia enterocolitica]|nr:hypothetical protein [Yersinia enterocolitica]ELI8374855.1 hypothetical protein [Yersinia enterocolitica]ELX2274162.1 hypothetical protein [Yersinia enterocolitica]HDL6704284.1 hypothetical protein [Yersinia enterocolitica]
MTKHQRFEERCNYVGGFDLTRHGNGYASYRTDLGWTWWQAAIKTPVMLPPLIDVDNLSGHELDCAKFHNHAIAMCSIAIRQAGYPSECSPMFYPTDKQGG